MLFPQCAKANMASSQRRPSLRPNALNPIPSALNPKTQHLNSKPQTRVGTTTPPPPPLPITEEIKTKHAWPQNGQANPGEKGLTARGVIPNMSLPPPSPSDAFPTPFEAAATAAGIRVWGRRAEGEAPPLRSASTCATRLRVSSFELRFEG